MDLSFYDSNAFNNPQLRTFHINKKSLHSNNGSQPSITHEPLNAVPRMQRENVATVRSNLPIGGAHPLLFLPNTLHAPSKASHSSNNPSNPSVQNTEIRAIEAVYNESGFSGQFPEEFKCSALGQHDGVEGSVVRGREGESRTPAATGSQPEAYFTYTDNAYENNDLSQKREGEKDDGGVGGGVGGGVVAVNLRPVSIFNGDGYVFVGGSGPPSQDKSLLEVPKMTQMPLPEPQEGEAPKPNCSS